MQKLNSNQIKIKIKTIVNDILLNKCFFTLQFLVY